MNLSRLEKIYIAILLVIFAGIVIHAPLSVGLGALFPDYSWLIKSWKEILMVIAVPISVILITRHTLWKELLNDWIMRCIMAFVALHFVLLLVLRGGLVTEAAGLAIDLRYVLFFGLVYVAVRTMPQCRRRFLQAVIIGAFIVVCFATLQLFLPADILSHIGYSKSTIAPYLTVDQNQAFVRVNSTLRGPNPLGAYAGVVLAFLAAAIVRQKIRWQQIDHRVAVIILAVCSTVALWISYSRSALIGGLVSVGVVLALPIFRRMSKKWWIGTVVGIGTVIGALVAFSGSSFVSNVLLHENPAGGSSVNSNEGHASSLTNGLTNLIRQPFGAGVGSTGSASLRGLNPVIIENQYLFVAHEAGWLGLVLFVVLFTLVLMRAWKLRQDWLALGVFASGVGLALIGLLLPVFTDDTVSIIWWGLAAMALAGGKYERTSK